jgi:hypothetical protein
LYIAVTQLNSTAAESVEACASLCNADERCEFYAWCPTNITSGCGIPAANGTYSSTVLPGGCILSCDQVANRTGLFIALGPAVPFISGEYFPAGAAGVGSRRLLQAGDGVWGNFSYFPNRFYQGVDALATIPANSAEECATACNADPDCYFWTRCPVAAAAAGCEVPSFLPDASPQTVPARTCLLSFTAGADRIVYFKLQGPVVAFEAGKWNASGSTLPPTTTAASPAPGTSPDIPIPTLPGVSPGGGNSTTQQPTPTGPLLIHTNWAGGPGNGTCWKWNGTDFEEDESSAFASSGTTVLDASQFQAYLDDLCSLQQTAAGRIAADLLAGSTTAQMAFAATTKTCPGASDNLLTALIDWVRKENITQDTEFAIKYATAWVQAGDQLGWALCVTVVAEDTATGKATVEAIKP